MIRRILISTLFEPEIPIPKNSKLDIALLRTAHQALLRQQSGVSDALLFVLCGDHSIEDATAAIALYGFPDVTVICISTKDEDGDEIDYGDVREQIGSAISHWLDKHHPGAISNLTTGGYDCLDIWLSGVEATDVEWDFVDDYATTLPDAHRKKAGTWVAILAEMLELEEPCLSNVNQLALYAATLCEWLHGFEAASSNSFNIFEADVVYKALKMDDFYLGFLLGQSAPTKTLYEILDNAEIDDLEGIRSYTLKQATSNERSTLRRILSKYFGSDTALLWTLHSAIWPKYNNPSADLCNDLVTPSTWEDVAEISEAWEFVTNGWTDSADE